MLKVKKLKNSTILLIGIILIFMGLIVGSFEYLQAKKNKAFSEMNIMFYESEVPEVINKTAEDKNASNEMPSDSPNNGSDTSHNNNDEPPKVYYNYIGTLEIPKINLKRGFLDLNSPYNNVDYNVTVINGSTFPDEENGNLILAAHSGNCYYCYFDNLYKLKIGDEAYLDYNGIKYTYKIVNIYNVKKTGKVAIHRDYNKNVLTLITCTRNDDKKQTVYILER